MANRYTEGNGAIRAAVGGALFCLARAAKGAPERYRPDPYQHRGDQRIDQSGEKMTRWLGWLHEFLDPTWRSREAAKSDLEDAVARLKSARSEFERQVSSAADELKHGNGNVHQ